MANQLLVLSHRRGECLWLCLESLRRCRGVEKYPLCLAINEDSNHEIPGIADKLWEGLELEKHVMPAGWGGLRCYGEALKHAFSQSDEYVITVEEDQEVSRDFFELLEYAVSHFRDERLFSVNAGRTPLSRVYTVHDNMILWVTHIFGMRGYLIFKEQWEKYVLPYLCEELYQSERVDRAGHHFYNRQFMENAFPDQTGNVFSMDGLIERVVGHFNLFNLTPVVPRNHVIGFYGVHARGITEEAMKSFANQSLESRVAYMKGAILTGAIKEIFGRFASEYWPIADDHTWGELRVRSEGMY